MASRLQPWFVIDAFLALAAGISLAGWDHALLWLVFSVSAATFSCSYNLHPPTIMIATRGPFRSEQRSNPRGLVVPILWAGAGSATVLRVPEFAR